MPLSFATQTTPVARLDLLTRRDEDDAAVQPKKPSPKIPKRPENESKRPEGKKPEQPDVEPQEQEEQPEPQPDMTQQMLEQQLIEQLLAALEQQQNQIQAEQQQQLNFAISLLSPSAGRI